MNASNHFLLRYCQRILDINEQEREIKQYIAQNRERLIEDGNKLYEHAQYIWKGQLYDNVTRNYYIKDNIIIVTDTQNTTLVTLYRVDFGFPEATNRKVTKDLLKEVDKLNKQIIKEEDKVQNTIDKQEIELHNIDQTIKALENQINILKQRKNTISEEVKDTRNNTTYLQEELRKYATMLTNSLEYKNDIKELKKTG